MKKNRALFLDRDGTINVDKSYVHAITDFEFIDGAVEALKYAQDAGYKLIIITNQSGIGRGLYTVDEYERLNEWMISQLRCRYNIQITASYYCPHLPDAIVSRYKMVCNCRKPQTGLFEQAISDNSIELNGSFCVGDRLRDLSICEKSECHGFLINTTEDKKVIEAAKAGQYRNIEYADNLLEAVKRFC